MWEYKDESSSGFYMSMFLSTKSHVSPYGTPWVYKRFSHSAV